MKRCDLPPLATVEMPNHREVFLVNGGARDTHLFNVVHLPTGLPQDAVPRAEYLLDQPLVALIVPATMVKSVDWETLKAITEAEQAERKPGLT